MRGRLLAMLCGLLLALSLTVSPSAQAAAEPLGAVSARDQKVHSGCHHYRFRYRVSVPTDLWSAEVFLRAPRGGKVGSAFFISGADPTVGRSVWRLCRRAMVPGRYTMRMKVSYIDGYDLRTDWVKPSRFRITRRR